MSARLRVDPTRVRVSIRRDDKGNWVATVRSRTDPARATAPPFMGVSTDPNIAVQDAVSMAMRWTTAGVMWWSDGVWPNPWEAK